MNGTYVAVIDRIVDGKSAVLLVEEDGVPIEQVTLDVSEIPEDGRHDGALFDVTVEDDEVIDIDHRPEAEAARRNRLAEKFDRLSKRLSEE